MGVLNSAIATPLSRKVIRNLTRTVRQKINTDQTLYFPVIHFIEWFLPMFDNDFSLEILSISTMGNCHGKSYPSEHKICLRQDVYERACVDVGRDRFTIAHEIGHYFIHTPDKIQYARMESYTQIPSYMQPEWQANTFAAELLVPHDLILGMDCSTIARECAVSYQVAKIQQSKF